METIIKPDEAIACISLHDEDTELAISKLLSACMARIDCQIFFTSRYEGKGSLNVDVRAMSTSISGMTLNEEILKPLTNMIAGKLHYVGYRIEKSGYVFRVVWTRTADPGC